MYYCTGCGQVFERFAELVSHLDIYVDRYHRIEAPDRDTVRRTRAGDN